MTKLIFCALIAVPGIDFLFEMIASPYDTIYSYLLSP